MTDLRIPEILRHIHPESGFRPWHGGPTVVGALKGVSPGVAAWRPYPDRHSIWALALHVAYWNYAVTRRLTGGAKGSFGRSPSNFPAVPAEPSAAAWDEDRRFVRRCHDDLVAAIQAQDPALLDGVAGDEGETTRADLITGVLLHDTYHAGQIQMLKRLAASAGIG